MPAWCHLRMVAINDDDEAINLTDDFRIGEQIAQILSTLGKPSVSTERHNINSKFKAVSA